MIPCFANSRPFSLNMIVIIPVDMGIIGNQYLTMLLILIHVEDCQSVLINFN